MLMNFNRKALFVFAVGLLALALVTFHSEARDKAGPEEYQAQAMGQGTQMGQNFNVTVRIEEYSTPARWVMTLASRESSRPQME
jgi:hypothetical protein